MSHFSHKCQKKIKGSEISQENLQDYNAMQSGIPNTSMAPQEWTFQEVHNLVQAQFRKRPCWYQVKTAFALYAGKDVIGCTPTGAGKLCLDTPAYGLGRWL